MLIAPVNQALHCQQDPSALPTPSSLVYRWQLDLACMLCSSKMNKHAMVMQIRQQEQSARKAIVANPVKMDHIKAEVSTSIYNAGNPFGPVKFACLHCGLHLTTCIAAAAKGHCFHELLHMQQPS